MDLAGGRWNYRLGDSTGAIVQLASGDEIDTREIGWAFNRTSFVTPEIVAQLGPDAPYAQSEWHALLLSFLHELRPGVINAPQAPSLAGPLLSHIQWLALACQAEFETAQLTVSMRGVRAAAEQSVADIWIVGEASLRRGPVSDEAVDAAHRLARLAGATVLHVSLNDECQFLTADPSPDLRIAGDDIVPLLADHARTFLT